MWRLVFGIAEWCFEGGETGGQCDVEGGFGGDGEDKVVGLEKEGLEVCPAVWAVEILRRD